MSIIFGMGRPLSEAFKPQTSFEAVFFFFVSFFPLFFYDFPKTMKVLLLVVLLGLVQGKVYNNDYRFGQSVSLPGVPMCSTFDDLKDEQG
jgi:hypothetical protein